MIRLIPARLCTLTAFVLAALAPAGCGSGTHRTAVTTATATTSTVTSTLPGKGRPPIAIGDKNFTEQFVLGELYQQALTAQGFDVTVNRNIGPTEVTIHALETGRLGLYPEYLGIWNSAVAGDTRTYRTADAAYRAAQRYARRHGLELLQRTPFSNVDGIVVTPVYAAQNDLHTIGDLARLSPNLTLGAPPQFKASPTGLPAIEQIYGVTPRVFQPLAVGAQYQALLQGTVQAADIATTDGQLQDGEYRLLGDPRNVFGWGNVVPVAPRGVLTAEGPVFAQTINAVSALLSTPVMRQLNADVDIAHQDPVTVARQFLQANGLLTTSPTS